MREDADDGAVAKLTAVTERFTPVRAGNCPHREHVGNLTCFEARFQAQPFRPAPITTTLERMTAVQSRPQVASFLTPWRARTADLVYDAPRSHFLGSRWFLHSSTGFAAP